MPKAKKKPAIFTSDEDLAPFGFKVLVCAGARATCLGLREPHEQLQMSHRMCIRCCNDQGWDSGAHASQRHGTEHALPFTLPPATSQMMDIVRTPLGITGTVIGVKWVLWMWAVCQPSKCGVLLNADT